MNLDALSSLLDVTPLFQRLQKSLIRQESIASVEMLSSATPFILINLAQRLNMPMLVITPRPEDSIQLYEQMELWNNHARTLLHFPETETMPFEHMDSDSATAHQRLSVLSTLITQNCLVPIVVASAGAATQKTIGRNVFASTCHSLKRNGDADPNELMRQWSSMGYRVESSVHSPGIASRRGGILDIYPVNSPWPVRIELWGTKIDSLRLFDPDTQCSTTVVDSINIAPAREILPEFMPAAEFNKIKNSMDSSNCTESIQARINEQLNLLSDGHEIDHLNFYSGLFNYGSLFDYFPKNGLVVMYKHSEIAQACTETDKRICQLRKVKEFRGELPLHFPLSHFLWEEFDHKASEANRRLDIIVPNPTNPINEEAVVLPFTSPPLFLGNIERFAKDAKTLIDDGDRIVVATSHSRRLEEVLGDCGISTSQLVSLNKVPQAYSITLIQTAETGLNNGFGLTTQEGKVWVFSDTELFGFTKQRRRGKRPQRRRASFLTEISPGDYVVHIQHGIGKFKGTGNLSDDKSNAEYLIIEYAQGDKLYVPLDHLDRVTSYVASLDRPPSLTRLGTQEWNRTKDRVINSTKELAASLLSLYATRELQRGYAFAPDSPWQEELEESFPYEETPDQLATINEVKADLESTTPMDRLICGDVGYGKTEVALRASFKAVMDGKQVAILVPTTILAQQHYATFSGRLSPYPTNIEVLSRFKTATEQQKIVNGIAKGQIDICIGTHRLIQRDVVFKNLGLVIIDEEQRFGVAHKERLKHMKNGVDTLTMTATPIPRTLNMSLSGVRDMSTMDTPPGERLPIKTYVTQFSEELIREAILREIDRQGQVYFLHNRIHNIGYMAKYVERMVPEAIVAIAHGRMSESDLEQTMVAFANREIDVLLCTTIIESGLDIPNANTLIINRADTFGLAQLYQLRGRIGRSTRLAYAYLIIPETQTLTDAAAKRLKAMLEATELGAGFHIAMKDLEIRGAGNILGREQSGHIHSVGYDLYTKLLSNAVEELRAQQTVLESPSDSFPQAVTGQCSIYQGHLTSNEQTVIDLGIPASIPQVYVTDLSTRLEIYQRLVKFDRLQQVKELEDELLDRFGPLPFQARNLLYLLTLKLKAGIANIKSIIRQNGHIVLQLDHEIKEHEKGWLSDAGHAISLGNTKVRIDIKQIEDGWEEFLLKIIDSI